MGWIKLDRSITEHFLWEDKPFSKGQAWVDLLLLANHKDHKIMYKDEVVKCKRGEVNRSIVWLAERWGWTRQKVRRFLNVLESDGMCRLDVTVHRTVITIENWAKYQDAHTVGVTTSGQQVDSKWTVSGHIQEGKEGKERKEKADGRLKEGSASASREARLKEMSLQDEEEKARLNRLAKERRLNEQRTTHWKIDKRS